MAVAASLRIYFLLMVFLFLTGLRKKDHSALIEIRLVTPNTHPKNCFYHFLIFLLHTKQLCKFVSSTTVNHCFIFRAIVFVWKLICSLCMWRCCCSCLWSGVCKWSCVWVWIKAQFSPGACGGLGLTNVATWLLKKKRDPQLSATAVRYNHPYRFWCQYKIGSLFCTL